jgi:uncharacterized protein (TIGR02246 family)
MKTFILSFFMLTTTIGTLAQDHKIDEQAINKQIEAFTASWNSHNFSDMQKYTTDDCDWVNVVGMWWKGRKEVQFAHTAFHNGMFRNTPLTTISSKIKFVTSDVAIAYVVTKIGTYYPPDGINHGTNKAGDEDNMGTLVFVKKAGTWLLTSGENVTISSHAVQSDPVSKMK